MDARLLPEPLGGPEQPRRLLDVPTPRREGADCFQRVRGADRIAVVVEHRQALVGEIPRCLDVVIGLRQVRESKQ
jgi:hypothetical protein